jgi:hypothetical protein
MFIVLQHARTDQPRIAERAGIAELETQLLQLRTKLTQEAS